jgi:uncharacterized membrane protein
VHGFVLSKGVVTQLDVPVAGILSTDPQGLNDGGTVVGYYVDASNASHGFTWKAGTYTELPDAPNAVQTVPYAINSQGDIAGSWLDGSGVTHGFLLKNGAYTSIDVPGAVQTIANGINDSDVILGYYCATQACIQTNLNAQSYTLSNGTFTNINLPWPIDTTYAFPSAINNAGTILGYFVDTADLTHSFTLAP